jgi:hypothetical protein
MTSPSLRHSIGLAVALVSVGVEVVVFVGSEGHPDSSGVEEALVGVLGPGVEVGLLAPCLIPSKVDDM